MAGIYLASASLLFILTSPHAVGQASGPPGEGDGATSTDSAAGEYDD